jgi:acetoin utilization deacetylase AcuC-like enzyme
VITAYHHAGFAAPLGDHVMPMRKFQLVADALAGRAGVKVEAPPPIAQADLLRVHTSAYVEAVRSGEPRALAESQKFPWSPALWPSVLLTNGGALAAATRALDDGVAAALASGFHHAHADHGEGFCTFNGLVVALEHARAERRIQRALVIDLDLHYGNGTAALLATRPDFHNLSVYGSWYEGNRASSDVTMKRATDTDNCRSVAVPNGASGAAYLAIIDGAIGPAIERARATGRHPDRLGPRGRLHERPRENSRAPREHVRRGRARVHMIRRVPSSACRAPFARRAPPPSADAGSGNPSQVKPWFRFA